MLKYLKFIYLLLLFAAIAFLAWQTIQLSELVNQANSIQSISAKYLQFQKNIGILNIVSFTVLLCISFLHYYKSRSKNFIYITNLLFTVVVLLNYVSINRTFYSLNGNEAMDSGSFWLMVFIGLFYIAGAIIVSAIGLISVKNFLKRHDNN